MESADLKNNEKRFGSLTMDFIIYSAGAVFLIPLLYSTATIDPVLLPRFLAWALLTLSLIICLIIQKSFDRNRIDFSIVFRAIFFVLLIYLLISAISLSYSINLQEGIFDWLKTFVSISFLLVGSLIMSRHKNNLWHLTRWVAGCGLILALVGIFQYWGLVYNLFPGNHFTNAIVANTNLFASALFLTLPFILYSAITSKGFWCAVSLAALFCIGICIGATQVRAVWMAIVLSGLLTGTLMFFGCRNCRSQDTTRYYNRKSMLVISFVIAAAMIAAVFFMLETSQRKSQKQSFPYGDLSEKAMLEARQIFSTDSIRTRFRLWKKSLLMITDNPLFGVGLGQWKIVLTRYGKIDKYKPSKSGIREVFFQRPHNDFLWVLAETGLLGFSNYVLFFLILIGYILRIVFYSADKDITLFGCMMFFGVIGYLIVSGFSFPKERIIHNVFLMLIAASILAVYHRSFPTPKKPVISKRWLLATPFIFLLLVLSVGLGYARLRSEIHTKNALSAYRAENWDRVIIEINKAHLRLYNLDPVSTPLLWYRGMANYALGDIQEALEDFKEAAEIHPYHIHVLNNLATCYARVEDYKKAEAYYRKALAISPHFEEARMNLDAIHLKME